MPRAAAERPFFFSSFLFLFYFTAASIVCVVVVVLLLLLLLLYYTCLYITGALYKGRQFNRLPEWVLLLDHTLDGKLEMASGKDTCSAETDVNRSAAPFLLFSCC